MRVEKFKVEKQIKVSACIQNKYPMLSYGAVQKILRNKDVKVNGVRLSQDETVFAGDEIAFYVNEFDLNKQLEVVYDDENVVIVLKPRNLETVTATNDVSLKDMLSSQLSQELFAVHRLDRNTQGLVIFAKNLEAKRELDDAIKHRYLQKFYLAEVYGLLKKHSDNMIAYLNKDEKNAIVKISSTPKIGYDKIQTNYKVLKENESSSIVEIELVTGKTHQIRAHFAHIGNFLIGDEKYGDTKINKMFKKRYQNLCAYKLIFHFEKGVLSYLNNKEIKLDFNKIDFCQNL